MSKLTVTAGVFAGVVIGAISGYLGASHNDIQEARQDLAEVQEQARSLPLPATPSVPPGEVPTETTIPGNGTWLVGRDIAPGQYEIKTSGLTCYWERLSGTTGNFDQTITNGNGNGGPIIVTIEPADVAFKTERCGVWVKTP